jgi:hypothetical protein
VAVLAACGTALWLGLSASPARPSKASAAAMGRAAASGFPSTSGKKASPNVSARFMIDGTGKTAAYSVKTPSDSPVGGFPGLIKYCVFPPTDPASRTALYDSWTTAGSCLRQHLRSSRR